MTTDFGGRDFGPAMALQLDGKIVVVGYSCLVVNDSCTDSSYKFALARNNTDGSLDASFGGSGKVTTDLPGTLRRNFIFLRSIRPIAEISFARRNATQRFRPAVLPSVAYPSQYGFYSLDSSPWAPRFVGSTG